MEIVDGSNHLDEVKELIKEYLSFLNRDLAFQNIDEELVNLGAKYAGSNGKIIIAIDDNKQVIGCVAYHKHNDKRCEMKRLYVKPTYRKMKIGKILVQRIIELAKEDGYEEMVLDTIKPLESAINLYKKFGFREIDAYYNNPLDDVIYMKLVL